jgi:hypothetical protein
MRGSAVFRTGVAPGGALAGPWVQNSLWTRARAVPSLDLRFADNKSLVDATTGAQLVTHTRASSGTYVDSQGVIRTATTNLLLRSEEFQTTWAATRASVTANSIVAPDGSLTADKITEDTTATATHLLAQTGTLISIVGSRYTYSVYAKADGRNWIVLSPGSTWGYAWFDISAGAVGTVIDGGGATTASITNVGNGWYRCVVSATAVDARGLQVLLANANNVVTYTGNGTSGIYLWGAQLEQASTVGEYIPTTSTINSAPRFDHNPTTGESLGLLVEEARTNVVTWSQDFSQADWTKNASTVVTTAIASPIQGVNYQKIEATSANTTVGITSVAVTAATQQRAVSFFAQPLGNISRVLVVVQGADARINVNLADGTFTTNAAATGSTVAVSGQRFSVSTPTLTNATGVRFFLKQTGDTDTNTPTTIAIGEGLYLIGAQMEAGAFPTSYIPTTSATVTRAADVASITGSNFGVTRTNLLVRSEEFDNASWTKSSASITTNTTTAPDGTITADTYSGTGSSGVRQTVTLTSGTVYTISFYVKSAGLGNDGFRLVINSAQSSSNFTATSEWQRFTFTATSANTGARTCGIHRNSSGGNVDVLIWGAQLEVGSAATPYIQSPSVFTSRASSGTYVGGNGLIQTAVTNLLLQSEDFSTTWANTDSTEASNVETAPNGTLTADKLIPDVGVTSGQFRQDVSKAATATTYTCSVYGKAAEFNRFSIRVEHNGSTGNRADVGFSLSDGSVVSAAAALGTFSGASATVTSVGAGWYRFTLSFTSSTETSIRVRLFGFDSSLPCNGTSGIYLWGAQLEQASTVGEYIPTTSTINSAARYDHDPVSLIGKGLLLEEARTNLLLRSEEFDNAYWIKNNTAAVTPGFEAPDGSLIAFKATCTDYNSANILASPGLGVISAGYRRSVWAKVASGTAQAHILGRHDSSNSLVTLTDQWQRFEATITDGTFHESFYLIDFRGSTTQGVDFYFWGAQLEVGAFATSYIPTTTATVTRAADISTSVATSVFESSWYNQTEGTNLIEFRETDRTGTRTPRSLSDGTASNRIDAFLSSSLTVNNRLVLAGVSYNPGNLTLSAAGTVNKHVASAAPGSAIAVTNGTLSTESAPPSLPVVNRIVIGADSIGGTPFTGAIRRITYWPTRLGNEVLQRITQ